MFLFLILFFRSACEFQSILSYLSLMCSMRSLIWCCADDCFHWFSGVRVRLIGLTWAKLFGCIYMSPRSVSFTSTRMKLAVYNKPANKTPRRIRILEHLIGSMSVARDCVVPHPDWPGILCRLRPLRALSIPALLWILAWPIRLCFLTAGQNGMCDLTAAVSVTFRFGHCGILGIRRRETRH
jgi:hypothetical protein